MRCAAFLQEGHTGQVATLESSEGRVNGKIVGITNLIEHEEPSGFPKALFRVKNLRFNTNSAPDVLHMI